MHLASPLKTALLAVAALVVTGCASIISDSKYPVSITSAPEGVAYKIQNVDGYTVHSGVTPDQVTLKAAEGYFDRAEYKVTFTKKGYATNAQALDAGIDGWYWGNLLFGGVIGLLIVDPATGAMYTLPERVHSNLKATPVASTRDAANQSLAQAEPIRH
ncbi:hypothetical protein V2K16_22675 [Pseudomonas alliivorans]|uniref:hypothetical protein n=1 Tax=Pseudomonas alliivorans TaxID=2810613 RepID=UPI001AE6B465|nr:hypothetical protein [Pseudomonas alliivorans]MBP0943085.1 hypothetical protein [Pseudomonas alliivorans]MEE4881181.1 hypothetical protein [Pseudomonas alliivorans]MEE4932485.1 hypothetical protein [Pseudomonas alliivorans]MEE4937948.1 hypothetical protein [Pseudomonas alliivorans]MEE4943119.1 hypothetical protein [Pseudomonas alliivorans]